MRKIVVRTPCPSSTKNWGGLLQLKPSLSLPALHPPSAAALTQQEWPEKEKETQGHTESMDTSQGWQSFNNLGLEKLYKYIYYQDVSTCYYYQLTFIE